MKRAPIHRLYTRIAADHRAEHPGRKVRILSVLGMRAHESRARALLPPFDCDPRASNQTIRHVDQWLLAVAGEYRHKTITDTYLSAPARSPVIAAKLVVYALFGALSGVASTVVGLIVAAALWSDKGASFAWGNSAMWATIGGGIAWNAAFAAIGVGVGALIRSLVGAIAVALAWIALVEGIVGQLIGNLARWLPFDAGQALGAASRPMLSASLLPRWGGAAVLAAYTPAFAALAVTTTIRRDVP